EAPEARLRLQSVARARHPPAGTGAIAGETQRARAGGWKPPRGDGQVLLPGGTGAKARSERRGRLARLAEDHHPRGVAVEPVYQARVAAEVRGGEQQQADDASGGGLRGEARRLVHREHLVVLVEDTEWREGGRRRGGAPTALLQHDKHLGPGRDGE